MNAADVRTLTRHIMDQLGLTADTVADRFRALDVKGRRGCETCCPLAVHLLEALAARIPGAVTRVEVAVDEIALWLNPDMFPGDHVTYVELTDACALFVRRVDTTDMYDGLLLAEVTA